MSCDIRSGLGLQIWRDGSVYEGEFFSGKPHGRGRLIHASHTSNIYGSNHSQDLMMNQNNNDQTQESDEYNQSGCDVYEGEWMDGKAHGFGDYCNFNGTTYKGYWVADR